MAEFFDMGGYAAFVWPSYAVGALVLVGLLVATRRTLKAREATLKALEGGRPSRRRRRDAETGASSAPPAALADG